MKIIYKLTNGRASDLRFKPEAYALALDEVEIEGDALPDIETLHTAPEHSAAGLAILVIQNEETTHKISQRFLRELSLQIGLQAGIITPVMLDYTIPLDTAAASWTSLNYGAQLCVLQERICTEQRAIIKASGG